MSVPERMRTYSVGLGRGAREARVDHDHLAADFLGMQHVQHRHRVRLGGVAADVQRSLRVLHVVVRIGHRAVAPGVGHAGHRGAVADARLVVAVVAAPQAHPLAQQVRLLVVVLGRADDEDRIDAALLAQLEHLGADLVERLVPADALVLAVDQLHRVLEAVLAVAVLAHGRALGAVRAQVDRAVEHRLLAHPDAVLDHRVDRAAHRAVAAHRALDLDLGVRVTAVLLGVGRLGLAHQHQLRRRHAGADAEARAAQEGAAIERRDRARHAARQAGDQAR